MVFAKSSLRLLFIAAAGAVTAWAALILSPAPAEAARPNGYPVTNVNLRAGPGTDYPVIVTVPPRAPIAILGCLADYGWCDVIFQNARGWMRSIYLAGFYQGSYYTLRDYAPRLRYPIVAFDIDRYWDSNYRSRPFYGERARWTAPRQEGWINKAVFYDRLSPYGQWVWLQGQYVWVPSHVDRQWRPYTVGRWVYTDRYGWMWASNEPFGWATYHYGRWGFSNRVGWFWVPGSRWAPAWVSWRSSDDYLAWAPMPPGYDEQVSIDVNVGSVPEYYWQAVPSREFLSDDLPRRIVRDRERMGAVLEHTRPLGNVTINNNNVVVNTVVNVQYVEEKTKEKVVVHQVARTKDAAKSGKIEGAAVEVYQPAADQAPATAAPPQPKKIEDVAKGSETKEQAGSEAATDEMLVPPEIKKAAGKSKRAAPAAGEAAKEGEAAPPAPGEQAPLSPSLPKGEEASSPPPEAASGVPAPAGEGPPPPAADEAPPPPPPSADEPPVGQPLSKELETPAPTEAAPPPPPADDAGAPEAKGKGKIVPEEPLAIEPSAPTEAPPPPPLQEEAAPEVKKGAPKVKKDKGEAAKPQDVPAVEPLAPMEPPPPPAEAAPPPTLEGEAPKAKKDVKRKKDKEEETQPEEAPAVDRAAPPPPPPPPPVEPPPPPPPPPAEEPAPPPPPPPAEEAAPPPPPPPVEEPASPPPPPAEQAPPPPPPAEAPAKGEEGKKPEPCPEGTVRLEDGTCAPAE